MNKSSEERRDFLKLTGTMGIGLLSAGITQACATAKPVSSLNPIQQQALKPHTQKFNMSGYGAPKIETVRIGYIGMGNRGSGALNRIVDLENVEVKALCDIRPEKAQEAKTKLENIYF
mgnify:CR=1 FL=1